MMDHNLKHLAIIMDGNARWAKLNGMSKANGHKQGAKTAQNIIGAVLKQNIPYLTLYAFSSENWGRPASEVSILLNLMEYYLSNELESLQENGIRLKIIGRLDRLSSSMRNKINNAMEKTSNNTKMTLAVGVGYGSRYEIIDACQKLIDQKVKTVTEDLFKQNLYDPAMPDVDMLVRPGGTCRISNFLLWHAAYAELLFTDKYWPEFTEEDIVYIVNAFSKRERFFGKR